MLHTDATDELIKVLLIEDDEDDYYIFKNKLDEIKIARYQLDWEDTFDAGVHSMRQHQHDVCLVDYNLGERNGLEFLEEALRQDFHAPIILLTGQGGQAIDVAAIASGAADYLSKGQITATLLERSIRHSIQQKRAEHIVRSLNAELEQRVKQRTAELEIASRELLRSNKILTILDRNQQDFIEIAAHELRTPLTVMIGYISMMKLNPLVQENKALEDLITGLGKGAKRLHEVVNSMLDVRRVDSGMLRIVSEQVILPNLIDEIVQSLQDEARPTRKLSFVVENTHPIPPITIDPALMQKAIHHIIINAIKYTPDGGKITIHTRQVVLKNNQPGIEISITDTGIGLDAEHGELIFEKFYQVGPSTLHSSSQIAFKGGGPGLGLAIARGIIQAHNGVVWLESPGYDEVKLPGSTVYIHLPLVT